MAEPWFERWFERKRIGWGWTPITWQGWVVAAGSTALVAGVNIVFDRVF